MRDITLEDTAYFFFTTRAFTTGVPTTLAGTPDASVLESNNATPITAGVSIEADRASVTGLNQVTVVATAANGYEVGKSYGVYISTGTVGGVSVVGEVIAEFTIQASAAAVDLANGTDGLGAIKTETAAILLDTGTTLDGRIPAALGADGFMKASVFGMMGTALTETAGLIAAGFKKFFNVATPTGTVNSLPDAVAGAASGLAIVGSQVDLVNAPNATAVTAIQAGLATPTNITAATGITLTPTTGLGNQTANITGTITTVTTATNLTNAPTNGDLTATMKASVNAEVVDALATDTYAEPAQGTPASTASIAAKIGYLFKAWRNKSTQTATEYALYNDDAVTVDHKSAVSDNGTTFSRGEVATGP
jgi:hypothetical protein